MNEKIKYITIGLLIGIISFPTIVLGGTFAVSLLKGKDVNEAIALRLIGKMLIRLDCFYHNFRHKTS